MLFNEFFFFSKIMTYHGGLGIALKKILTSKNIHTLKNFTCFYFTMNAWKKIQKLNCSPEKYRRCGKLTYWHLTAQNRSFMGFSVHIFCWNSCSVEQTRYCLKYDTSIKSRLVRYVFKSYTICIRLLLSEFYLIQNHHVFI